MGFRCWRESVMSTSSAPAYATPNTHEFVERLNGAEDLAVYRDHVGRYRFALQWASRSRVLDVCCGVGYGSLILAAGGAVKVLGVDISDEAILAAQAQPQLPNMSFEVRDACTDLPGTAEWDLITCFEGIEHVPDPAALLAQIYKCLAPGGIAVITTPNSDAYGGGHSGNPFHPSEMGEADFRKHISAHAWKTEWYAQNCGWIWSRPRWQYAVLPILRALKGNRNSSVPAGEKVGITENAAMAFELNIDEGYLMPWNRGVSISEGPPSVICAICQKPRN